MFSFFFVIVGFAMGYWFRKKQRTISDWFKNPEERKSNNGDKQ